MSTFFEAGSFGGRAVPAGTMPRIPAEVRKQLRRFALAQALFPVGMALLAVWNIQQSEASMAASAAGVGALLALGATVFLSFTGWHELPPRTDRSASPGWVGSAMAVVVAVIAALQKLDVIATLPRPIMVALGLGGLALYCLFAAWSVATFRWRMRLWVALAFASSGALVLASSLAAALSPLPAALFVPANIAAAGLATGASAALGLATWRSVGRATDQELI